MLCANSSPDNECVSLPFFYLNLSANRQLQWFLSLVQLQALYLSFPSHSFSPSRHQGWGRRLLAWQFNVQVNNSAATKLGGGWHNVNQPTDPWSWPKRSKIEGGTSFNIIVNFGLLSIMCLVSAIFRGLENATTGTSAEFCEIGSDPITSHVINAIITFVSVPPPAAILSLTKRNANMPS